MQSEPGAVQSIASATPARHREIVTLLIGMIIIVGFAIHPARADVFIVDSILDDGEEGTLRWAIEQANGTPGLDTIEFDVVDPPISDNAVNFEFDSAMPDIVDELIIDGGSSGGDYGVVLRPPDGQDVSIQADFTLIDATFGSGQSLQIDDPTATLQYTAEFFEVATDRITTGSGSLAASSIDVSGTRSDVVFAGNMNLPMTTVRQDSTLRGRPNAIQNTVVLEDSSTLIFQNPLDVGSGFVTPGTDGIFSGSISGTGRVVKDGADPITLAGTTSHTGGTEVWEGELIGATDSLRGNVYICPTTVDGVICPDLGDDDPDPTLVFDQSDTGTFDSSGSLVGEGDLRKTGGGELIIDSDQTTFLGDTTIDDGTLTLRGNGLIGSPTVTVEGGAFNLDDVIHSSAVAVESGGTLTGDNGIVVGNVTIASGGTFSGAAMEVQGDLDVSGRLAPSDTSVLTAETLSLQSGATLSIVANSDGTSGSIDVEANTANAITVTNTLVNPTFTSGSYPDLDYSLVTAQTGSTSGFFLNETEFFGFSIALSDQPCSGVPDPVGLCMNLTARTGQAFSSFAETPNQYAVATALDAGDTSDPDFMEVFDAFNTVPLSEIPDIYDDLSGDQLAAFTNLRLATNNRFNRGISRRFDLERASITNLDAFQQQQRRRQRQQRGSDDLLGRRRIARGAREANLGRHPGQGGWAAWLDMDGIFGSLDSNDGNTADTKYTIFGPLIGLDYGITEHLTLGGSFGYARADLDSQNRSTDGKADIYEGGLYLGAVWDRGYVVLAGRYASSQMDTTRKIQISDLRRTAHADFGGNEYAAFLEGAWNFEIPSVASGFAVQPVVYLAYDHLQQDAFSEVGADSLDLSLAEQKYDSLVTGIGARIGVKTQGVDGTFLHPQLRVAWEHLWLDRWRTIDAHLNAASTDPPAMFYEVEGARLPANVAVVGISTEAGLSDTLQLFLDYDARLGSGFYENYLSLGFRKIF